MTNNSTGRKAEQALKRTTAREEAIKLVYQMDIRGEAPDEMLDLYKQLNSVNQGAMSFIEDEVKGVFGKLDEIDAIISENLKKRKIDRLSKIVCAAVRVAIYEMEFCDDVPTGVAISEAVKFVKNFADEETASFANAILGTVSRRNDQ